ncbi:MAG: ATP-binding cassette domain-containing protein, partial [Flavobacteriales bacterium]|nr:ATP-binding cassette domain-containing protein [Flavobacteriales bacterium]
MIRATSITKRFGDLAVLKGVDLHVAHGEVVSIVGASGAGKTTLLQILGTLEKADGGSLVINGEEVTKLGSKALSAFRNKH